MDPFNIKFRLSSELWCKSAKCKMVMPAFYIQYKYDLEFSYLYLMIILFQYYVDKLL